MHKSNNQTGLSFVECERLIKSKTIKDLVNETLYCFCLYRLLYYYLLPVGYIYSCGDVDSGGSA